MGKKIVIYGGGTVSHVRPHLAICAPAYGAAARRIQELCADGLSVPWVDSDDIELRLTKMAGGHSIETNADLAASLVSDTQDDDTKVIFQTAAVCDFTVHNGSKSLPKLASDKSHNVTLWPTEKLIDVVRQTRKDIFLVGFKTTAGATPQEQAWAGLALLKRASCNLVMANDIVTGAHVLVTPEEVPHRLLPEVDADVQAVVRDHALRTLVSIVGQRSWLHFTRSRVVGSHDDLIGWYQVPEALQTVVGHCIGRGAYHEFKGRTVGHFAYRDANGIVTTVRKSNFNLLPKGFGGMVRIDVSDPSCVVAHGAKPSVGGMSQRVIFREHPELDCIVHFHCPPRDGADVARQDQMPYECGSEECAINTSRGLRVVGDGIAAVYLDRHGPNVVFRSDIDPARVIDYIEANFDLTKSTSILPEAVNG